jgi:hypothetical protein
MSQVESRSALPCPEVTGSSVVTSHQFSVICLKQALPRHVDLVLVEDAYDNESEQANPYPDAYCVSIEWLHQSISALDLLCENAYDFTQKLRTQVQSSFRRG